jgi:hypothetical protein
MLETLVSRINHLFWHHVATFPRRPQWQRGLLQAIWVATVALVIVWIFKFDCPIC